MTPAQLRAARDALGLSAEGFAELLQMPPGSGRTVRRWEAGHSRIPGPVAILATLIVRSPTIRAELAELALDL